jgi:DNA-binding NarL/FixJ family response regulator
VIRVVIADDQPLMRAAFDMTIKAEEDMAVVGQAADGAEAVGLARRLRPDVVLMDVRMPGMDGVEATRQLCREEDPPRVLLLTTFEIDGYAVEALRAGASGFLLKDVQPAELAEAIRTVAAGEALLATQVTGRLLEAFAASAPPVPPVRARVLGALTEAELRVLTLMGRGLSNEEIARELFVAETTVRTHVRHILDKLDLRDRVQAVVLAYDAGLVEPNLR